MTLLSTPPAYGVVMTYRDGSSPLRRRDHIRRKRLRGVHTLAHFLLDEMHGEGKLLPGQLAHLSGVGQSPAGSGEERPVELKRNRTTQSRLGPTNPVGPPRPLTKSGLHDDVKNQHASDLSNGQRGEDANRC